MQPNIGTATTAHSTCPNDGTVSSQPADAPAAAPVLEFCAENITHVPLAIAAGAARIELCDNLAVGGTSPSPGVVAACVRIAHARGVRVMAMVRPRGGDFVYEDIELDAMEADIAAFAGLGVDGIVLGCLAPTDVFAYGLARAEALAAHALPGEGERPYTGGYRLDIPTLERLCGRARSLGVPDITFHMAFDALPESAQLAAIDTLADLGCTRILTHGGPAGTPIEENLARLRALADAAAGRLTILPGAGITWRNRDEVAQALGASELHGTKIVRFAG